MEIYGTVYSSVDENYGVVKFNLSNNELSINLDLGSFQYTWSVYYRYTCTEYVNSSPMSRTTNRLAATLYVTGLNCRRFSEISGNHDSKR